jgi:hypothetical protein
VLQVEQNTEKLGIGMVLWETRLVAGTGAAAGVAIAFGLSRFLRSLVFGVTTTIRFHYSGEPSLDPLERVGCTSPSRGRSIRAPTKAYFRSKATGGACFE